MLTVAWVTGMSLYTTDVFWDNYSNSGTIYIIVVPMILALTVGNFFCHIDSKGQICKFEDTSGQLRYMRDKVQG